MKLSIIIPVYNTEKYIKKCIDSCLRLHGVQIEIIVINDGSTDGVLNVIDENYAMLENLYIYTTENKGLSAARNYGMKKATGDYIIFLDSDDWLRTDINKILENDSELTQLDVLFYNCQSLDECDGYRLYPEKHYPIDCDKTFSGEEIMRWSRNNFACGGFLHYAWCGIYNREFLCKHDICFLDGILYEDYDFWFKVLLHAKKIRYSNRICYGYRLRKNSITHSSFSPKILDSFFLTVKSILSPKHLSDAYLACAGANLELFVIYCEARISYQGATIVSDDVYDGTLKSKYEIIKLIDVKYVEDTLDHVKIKYRLLSHVIFCFGVYDDVLLNKLFKLRKKITDIVVIEMRHWGLGDSTRSIGLYGSGEQADVMLNTYCAFIGEVKAQCYYIDSYASSYERKHYNRPIINIDDIDKENIDEVIICSSCHEESMRLMMEEKWPDVKLYSPYRESNYSMMWLFCGNYAEIYLRLKATQGAKRILLLETPEYPNVGDHLIAVAGYEFLKEYFPGHEIIEITNDEYYFYKCRIKRMVTNEDILVITGGGFFGSLWRERHYDQALDIMERFPDNKILVLPQSIYFEDTELGVRYKVKTQQVFDRKQLKVACREKFSKKALENLRIKKESMYEGIDIAFFYKFDKSVTRNETIGVFLRDDKESVFQRSDREKIDRIIVYSGLEILHSSMQYDSSIHKEERKLVVEEKLEEIAGYRIVITDQLHCMISCVLTKTPCIAFNNVSKKLEGIFEYIEHVPYIRFLHDTTNFDMVFNELINLDTRIMKVPDFQSQWESLAEYYKQN